MLDKVTQVLCWNQRAGPGGPGGAEGGTCKEMLLVLGFSVVPAPAPLPSVCQAISVCLKHPGARSSPTRPRAESKAYMETVSALRVSL